MRVCGCVCFSVWVAGGRNRGGACVSVFGWREGGTGAARVCHCHPCTHTCTHVQADLHVVFEEHAMKGRVEQAADGSPLLTILQPRPTAMEAAKEEAATPTRIGCEMWCMCACESTRGKGRCWVLTVSKMDGLPSQLDTTRCTSVAFGASICTTALMSSGRRSTYQTDRSAKAHAHTDTYRSIKPVSVTLAGSCRIKQRPLSHQHEDKV